MPNLPDGWVTIPLGRCGDWFGGGTPSKRNPSYWNGGSTPWVSPKDMKADRIGDTKDYVTDLGIENSTTRVVAENSLLIVTRSGILRHSLPVALANKDVAFNQDIKALTLFSGIDPEYVLYHLKADADDILDACAKAGTTVESLDFNRLKSYPLRIAPSLEQRRIVEKLDILTGRTDRAHDELSRIPELVAKYKSCFLRLAFTGQLTSDFRGEHSRKGTGVENIPDSWAVKPLGEISEIQGGVQVGKKRSSSTDLVEVPYLRVANVQRGWLDLEEIKTIGVTPQEKERLLLRMGDILMNEGGDRDKLGRGWVWNNQIADCIHQNHVFRIRLKDSSLPPEFVSHYANEMGQQYFVDQGTQTTNLASISKRKLAALPVPVPPSDEAVEIVNRIDAAFAWLERISSEQAAASKLLPELDAAILSKAFRGELARQNPDDEPASRILARVSVEGQAAPTRKSPHNTRKRKVGKLTAKSLVEVLEEAMDWIPAQEAFSRCGIVEGSETTEIEAIYAQLRVLDKSGRLEVRAVRDKDGRKQYDQLKLRAA